MDTRSGKYLGKKNYLNKTLDSMMKYYRSKKYHIIEINVYDDYEHPELITKEEDKNYLENLKIMRE
jgi:hypothetical protein